MATVTPSRVPHPLGKRNLEVWKWAGVNASDVCTPVVVGGYSDKTVFMLKGSAFGGNMSLTGSPDPAAAAGAASFITLNDSGLNAISGKTADFTRVVLESPYQIAPVAAAGVVTVDVWLVLHTTK